jgi:hypothetical protein
LACRFSFLAAAAASEAKCVSTPARLQRFGEPLGAEVRRTDRLHLALLDQVRISAQRFLEWGVGIVPVRLVEVDCLYVQTPERLLDRVDDVVAAQALLAKAHVRADLGRDHYVVMVAALRDPAPDDRLGFTALVAGDPARVGIRGIDQIEAGIDERVEQAK